MTKKRLLFLCTGNACRSQMAEGWARHLLGETIEAFSAGVEAHGLDPRAVAVMAEAGVDISGHRSKRLDELARGDFDLVITLCDAAAATCPTFPGASCHLHHPFDDPPRLARSATSPEAALEAYRRVRDEIRDFVATLSQARWPLSP